MTTWSDATSARARWHGWSASWAGSRWASAPVAPPPGFARQMAAEILDRPNRWRRWVPLAVAAGLTLVSLGASMSARHEGRELRERLASRESRLAALEDTLSVLRRANMVLQTQISMNGHEQGGLLIFQDAVSHRWCVIVHGLPPAPTGSKYQFWFITETGMVRSVEVNADTRRPAFMTLPMPGVAAPVMGAALTMEPMAEWVGPAEGCDAGARDVLGRGRSP